MDEPLTKICGGKHGCGRLLPIDEFPRRRGTGYYSTYCKPCCGRGDTTNRAALHEKRVEAGGGVCGRCKEFKGVEDFTYRTKICRRCNRDKKLIKMYGITADEFDAKLSEQGGGCAICGRSESIVKNSRALATHLSVDHDHVTGTIRGILCDHCNNSLGRFDDDPHRLRRAADYIESYR